MKEHDGRTDGRIGRLSPFEYDRTVPEPGDPPRFGSPFEYDRTSGPATGTTICGAAVTYGRTGVYGKPAGA